MKNIKSLFAIAVFATYSIQGMCSTISHSPSYVADLIIQAQHYTDIIRIDKVHNISIKQSSDLKSLFEGKSHEVLKEAIIHKDEDLFFFIKKFSTPELNRVMGNTIASLLERGLDFLAQLHQDSNNYKFKAYIEEHTELKSLMDQKIHSVLKGKDFNFYQSFFSNKSYLPLSFYIQSQHHLKSVMDEALELCLKQEDFDFYSRLYQTENHSLRAYIHQNSHLKNAVDKSLEVILQKETGTDFFHSYSHLDHLFLRNHIEENEHLKMLTHENFKEALRKEDLSFYSRVNSQTEPYFWLHCYIKTNIDFKNTMDQRIVQLLSQEDFDSLLTKLTSRSAMSPLIYYIKGDNALNKILENQIASFLRKGDLHFYTRLHDIDHLTFIKYIQKHHQLNIAMDESIESLLKNGDLTFYGHLHGKGNNSVFLRSYISKKPHLQKTMDEIIKSLLAEGGAEFYAQLNEEVENHFLLLYIKDHPTLSQSLRKPSDFPKTHLDTLLDALLKAATSFFM